jgi:hypothetical protein
MTVKYAGLICCAATLAASTALAGQPSVNTGFTSFLDGFGDPRGSGFIYTHYARLSTSSSVKDGQGNDIPLFQTPRFHAFADLNQFIYTFKTDGWVAHPGAYTIVPLIYVDASAGPAGLPLQGNGFGLGDMFVGGFLQFDPLMSSAGPFFTHRIEISCLAPTGKYDAARQVNPGANAWSLYPSWAATLLPWRLLELSVRLNYLYNFRNSDPGFGLDNSQAGQALFGNFAAAYDILPVNPQRTAAHDLRVGVNGYYFRQLTDNKANGMAQPQSREQVLGIGPGALWMPTGNDTLWLNVYFEVAVRNRFASNVFQVRWAHLF